MTFKVWNNRYNTTDELVVTNWIEGSNAYQTDAINQIGELNFVSNTANSSKLGLYPIPANKELNLELTVNQDQNITVGIYNLLGVLIETNTYTLEKGFNSMELNISSLKEGAYLCTITTNEGTNSRKFNVIK